MKRTLFLSLLIVFFTVSLVGCNQNSSKEQNPKQEQSTVSEKSSSDWVKINIDKNGNTWSYRNVRIEKDGGNYIGQVWVKTVYSETSRDKEFQHRKENNLVSEGYEKLSERRSLFEIDCKKQRTLLLEIVDYDTNQKELFSGSSKNYENYGDDEGWVYVRPDSLGDKIIKGICK
jgi:hypothetical protein